MPYKMKQIFNFFSSIKLAVMLILSLGTLLATGTFYESLHGTPMAQKFVYHSFYATILMLLLIMNLVCSAIDRVPWKRHHVGFVITHSGLIIIILGSFITQQKGIDGILYLPLHESGSFFSVDNTELRVYESMRGRPIVPLFQKPVDFDLRPPEKKNYTLPLVDDDSLKILKYVQRGLRSVSVGPAPSTESLIAALPALKFKMANAQVDVQEWLGLDNQLPPFFDFGPALVTFIQSESLPPQPQPRNQIVILQNPKTKLLTYAVYALKDGGKPKLQGKIKEGDEIETGWMGLKFKILNFIPSSEVKIDYRDIEPNSAEDSPNLTSAILAEVRTKVEKGADVAHRPAWFELDSPHEIRGDKLSYFVSFVRRKYNLGFKLELKKFKLGMYEGSNLPRSYESTVSIDGRNSTQVISMNEPLKYNGYTLYQSSFEQNERGEPIASIFSVNYDPGRAIKYIGAILLVFGIAFMFYIKPRWTRQPNQKKKKL